MTQLNANSPPSETDLTPTEKARVDALQDEHMAHESPDGRPPERHQRNTAWGGLFLIGLLVALAAITTAAYFWGMPAVIIGIVLIGLMALASAPAWGAGILRGKEERHARAEARTDVRSARQ